MKGVRWPGGWFDTLRIYRFINFVYEREAKL